MDNMNKPTVKRAYTPPKIVRVALNPEQAVLSVCSASASTLVDNDPVFCNPVDDCREMEPAGEEDSASTT